MTHYQKLISHALSLPDSYEANAMIELAHDRGTEIFVDGVEIMAGHRLLVDNFPNEIRGTVVFHQGEFRLKDEDGFIVLWDDGEKKHYSISLLDPDDITIL